MGDVRLGHRLVVFLWYDCYVSIFGEFFMNKILNWLDKSEKNMFYAFLILHLIVWTMVSMIRTVLPTDALEGIYWGSLQDFGTPKHPPLAGWLTYLAYIPFKSDFCVYLMSQSFILAGFIFIYKLAKKFLDDKKAMLSVILLEGCWCYSYITGYYGFNPDVILLFTLPAIAYVFYNCAYKNRKSDWLILGLLVGFAFLNKYQTGLLIACMAVWAMFFRREIFKNIFFYLAIIIAFIIFSPHLLWLIKYEFFPIFYFQGELSAPSWINHITAPLTFFIMQIVSISGTLLMYAILKFKTKSEFKIETNHEKSDLWFLLLLGLGPLVIHLLMGLYAGGTMRPRWGYEFWFMTGILLFYFLPCNIEKKEFKFVTKLACGIMLVIFLGLGGLLSIEKNYRSRYPVATVFNDMKQIWETETNKPLKYLGGYIEFTLPLTIYEKNPVTEIKLDTFGYPDPWLDEQAMKSYGVLIIDRNEEDVIKQTKKTCLYLPEEFKIEPKEYKFNVKNAFGLEREYTIHYFIVPPID